jgi:hypothetical protein
VQAFWKEKTGTKNPREWSTLHKTPALALVPLDKQADAKRAFGTLNRSSAEGHDVEFALEFLKKNEKLLFTFNDAAKIESAFKQRVLGRFAPVLTDHQAVRDKLDEVCACDAYDWYMDVAKNAVEKFAGSVYVNGVNKKVLAKIESIDETRLRSYLKRLIKDNVNVGVEILSENEW